MIRNAIVAAALVAAALALAAPVAAGPHDDVLAAVNTTLMAFNTNEAIWLQKAMLPTATIVAQTYGADGTLKTRVVSVADMASGFTKSDRHIDERIYAPVVLVQHDLAHVWAPYTLDINGKRLHCGIDSFGLAKVDGVWRVTSLSWTAEPKGCPG